jgi:HEPN domain-containing protein
MPTDDFSKSSYWDDMAEYDLETARAMQSTGRYLYVGFMCHQAVEKKLTIPRSLWNG